MMALLIAPQEQEWFALSDLLKASGHMVEHADSFILGRKLVETRTDIDLIVADANPPGRAMLEFVAMVKRDIRLNSIPIIAAGTEISEVIFRELLSLKVEDILVLPTEQATLQNKLATCALNGKRTVLVVDDEPAIVDYLHDILEMERFNVQNAYSAQDALQILDRTSIDIVVSDITMPGKTGMDLLVEIKERLPHIPVILISGNIGKYSPKSLIAAGADAYITKPFKNRELVYTLRSVIGRYGSRTRNSLPTS